MKKYGLVSLVCCLTLRGCSASSSSTSLNGTSNDTTSSNSWTYSSIPDPKLGSDWTTFGEIKFHKPTAWAGDSVSDDEYIYSPIGNADECQLEIEMISCSVDEEIAKLKEKGCFDNIRTEGSLLYGEENTSLKVNLTETSIDGMTAYQEDVVKESGLTYAIYTVIFTDSTEYLFKGLAEKDYADDFKTAYASIIKSIKKG